MANARLYDRVIACVAEYKAKHSCRSRSKFSWWGCGNSAVVFVIAGFFKYAVPGEDTAESLCLRDYLAAIALNDAHELRDFGLRYADLVQRVADLMRRYVELVIGEAKILV